MELTFAHKRVLLLGGSSEIGLAVAELLLNAGITPVLTYSSEQGRERISSRFPMLENLYFVNFNNLESLEEKKLYAETDALIDLAHEDYEALLATIDNHKLDAYCSAHIQNRAKLLKNATRQMTARHHGRLIHVSSLAAELPAPGQGLYAASKKAAEAMYHSYGVELGPLGITSVSIRLGLVAAGRGNSFINKKTSKHGNPRVAPITVSQAAGTILFLLSNEQAFHCTTLTMDAGFSAIKY